MSTHLACFGAIYADFKCPIASVGIDPIRLDQMTDRCGSDQPLQINSWDIPMSNAIENSFGVVSKDCRSSTNLK